MNTPLDCLVIGAGPAGLTAAIYLARFHLAVQVIDAGKSRAATIPRTHNHAGFPGGISGSELLGRMATQAAEFGAAVTPALAEKLETTDDGFLVHGSLTRSSLTQASLTEGSGQTWAARSVLLATGVVNNHPAIAPEIHDVALARGLLRYCPVCDGYEVTDRRIGVIGTGSHGCEEAIFLRTFTRDVTLLAPDGAHALPAAERRQLAEYGVEVVDGPCKPLRIEGDRIFAAMPTGEHAFDTIYPALGSVIRSELAVTLGADASEDGCLVVDAHQRTTVSGLYAAGDVTNGLDQISHAMGEAGVAATTIRNDLARERRLVRG